MLFKGKYFFLSNMCKFPYPYIEDGISYHTSENYYQASKTDIVSEKKYIASLNPYEAKKHSRTINIINNWDDVKIDVMTKIIDIKFNIPVFKYLLLSTREEELVEDNVWHDTFWGRCNGIGDNKLGIILMAKRSSLQKAMKIASKIRTGDLYSIANMDKYDYVGFTSNSTLNNKGELIMGKGTALSIKNMFPNLPKLFGDLSLTEPSFIYHPSTKIFALQTKSDWRNPSDIELIQKSLAKLKEFAIINHDKKIAIPIPGVNNGGLSIDSILPLLTILPDNIDIWKSSYKKIYTGVGSRTVPDEYEKRIRYLAGMLDIRGFRLRSGDADGSDTFFREESTNNEIYIPWKGFNNSSSELYTQPQVASIIASFHHIVYDRLKDSVKKLMDRNVLQVLGGNVDNPSDFIICYTADGCNSKQTMTNKTGGTGLAISIGDSVGVPIYNIANDDDYFAIKRIIENIPIV